MKIRKKTQDLHYLVYYFGRVSSIKYVQVIPFSLKSSCGYLLLIVKAFGFISGHSYM